MELGSGRREVRIGLVDGPVDLRHAGLVRARDVQIPGRLAGSCAQASNPACAHGTFVAGILVAKRYSPAPAICPACTLLLRPIFEDAAGQSIPAATPGELAAAIVDCVRSGACVINVSAALTPPSSKDEPKLKSALGHARKRGALVVAAAGNQGLLAGSAITREPWVVPVAACDQLGRPLGSSNLGSSIGRQGVSAPGAAVTSLGPNGKPARSGGTSAAAAFVTGAIALLWSQFPGATSSEIRHALGATHAMRRTSVVPPLLDAWAAYKRLLTTQGRR